MQVDVAELLIVTYPGYVSHKSFIGSYMQAWPIVDIYGQLYL